MLETARWTGATTSARVGISLMPNAEQPLPKPSALRPVHTNKETASSLPFPCKQTQYPTETQIKLPMSIIPINSALLINLSRPSIRTSASLQTIPRLT